MIMKLLQSTVTGEMSKPSQTFAKIVFLSLVLYLLKNSLTLFAENPLHMFVKAIGQFYSPTNTRCFKMELESTSTLVLYFKIQQR